MPGVQNPVPAAARQALEGMQQLFHHFIMERPLAPNVLGHLPKTLPNNPGKRTTGTEFAHRGTAPLKLGIIPEPLRRHIAKGALQLFAAAHKKHPVMHPATDEAPGTQKTKINRFNSKHMAQRFVQSQDTQPKQKNQTISNYKPL
jgi:hypothetical protein